MVSDGDTPRRRPWEEDFFGSEEKFLYAHGFHRVRGLEDMWQEGRAGEKLKESGVEPKMYTRQEAFERIAERMD